MFCVRGSVVREGSGFTIESKLEMMLSSKLGRLCTGFSLACALMLLRESGCVPVERCCFVEATLR